VLEEDDVVIGSRRRDGVPDPGQCSLLVLGVQHDLEYADVIRFADFGARECRSQLLTSVLVPHRGGMQQQHRDHVWLCHAHCVAGRGEGAGTTLVANHERAVPALGGQVSWRTYWSAGIVVVLRPTLGSEDERNGTLLDLANTAFAEIDGAGGP
jgi:hypothetical protein